MVSDDPAGPSSATATATGSGSTRPPRHTDLIFPSAEQHASMSSLLGSLKRSTLSVHNRLASIHADARFVSRAAAALSPTTTTTTTAATTSTSSNTTKGGGKTSRRKRKRQRQQKRQRRPLVANERCGSWYVPPGDKAASAYFKSTDGHERAWKFSTRRLNLHLVEMIEKNDGIIIVDSTRRGKRMPDALSTTIPVWCAVLNRVLLPHHPLSQELHLPPHLLPSTHAQVSALLPAFADSLRALRLGDALPRCLTKPLRPLWVTQDSALRFRDEDVDVDNDADEGVDGRDDDGDGDGDGVEVVDEEGYDHSGSGAEEQEEEQEEEEDDDDGSLFQDYRPVICLTASKRILAGTEADAGGYIQGAADDTENWAHGLTPSLFWAHTAELLSAPDDALPDLIASLVASASSSSSIPSSSSPTAATGTSTATTTAGTASSPSSSSTTTPLITTHRLTPQISVCALPLGASATAPPPAPEDSAGARRGPTTCHIALGSAPTPKDTWVRSPTYMNVGLGKNKTAARNLRLALPEICSFAAKFLEKRGPDDQDGSGASLSELKGQQRPQIIIGCESGKDLSIGAALALSCYLFDDEGRVRAPTEGASFTKTLVKIRLGGIMTAYPECNPSRQTLQSVNSFLMDWRN